LDRYRHGFARGWGERERLQRPDQGLLAARLGVVVQCLAEADAQCEDDEHDGCEDDPAGHGR
jgi:hypothetical protein